MALRGALGAFWGHHPCYPCDGQLLLHAVLSQTCANTKSLAWSIIRHCSSLGPAAEGLIDFAREMQSQERQAGGLMIGVLGKARGYALRLAVILELLPWAWSGERSEPAEISSNSMRRAIKLMREYFLPMASRVLGDAAITQQERDGRTLAKWIAAERPDRINLRGLSRGETGGTAMHGLRDRKRLDAAAEWLRDCGWFLRDVPEQNNGRPRLRPGDRARPVGG